MLIDTSTLDTRAVAMQLLKRGGMDWIDQPADEVWGQIDEATRADREQWREGIIAEKQTQVDDLLKTITEVASVD